MKTSNEQTISIIFGFLTVSATCVTLFVGIRDQPGSADVVYSIEHSPALDGETGQRANSDSIAFEHFSALLGHLTESTQGEFAGGDSMVRVWIKNIGEKEAPQIKTIVEVPGTIVPDPSKQWSLSDRGSKATISIVGDSPEATPISLLYNRREADQQAPIVEVKFKEAGKVWGTGDEVQDARSIPRRTEVSPYALPSVLFVVGSAATAWLLRASRRRTDRAESSQAVDGGG